MVLAAVALCGLSVAACGAGKHDAAGGAAHARADSTPTATAEVVESQPTATRRRHRHHIALTACDANIKVNAATTSCAFAENVFFEYWKAAESYASASVVAYSPVTDRNYRLRCSEGTLIRCRAGDGAYVTFPSAAVDAYDADQAVQYACSRDLGPSDANACSDARRDAGASTPQPPSRDDCDPNYAGACLDPTSVDYDCEGGTGDGPDYTGQVEVVGDDHYGLDRDGDGIGCEDSASSAGAPSPEHAPDTSTTEDYGSGSGSVGLCADGTLSDSIGRPGACSHHGGVG